jgi:uncharacterized membrane protein YbaN (DUF454 family)
MGLKKVGVDGKAIVETSVAPEVEAGSSVVKVKKSEQMYTNVDVDELKETKDIELVRGYPEGYKRRLARLDWFKRIGYGILEGLKWRAREYPRFFGALIRYGRESAKAFWEAVWLGEMFPLNIPLHDFEKGEGRAFGRHVAAARLAAFLFVSFLMSFWLVGRSERKGVVVAPLVGSALIGAYVFYVDREALGMGIAGVAVLVLLPVSVFWGLGMWKTKRDFPGFRALLFGKLDETVERKKRDHVD